MGKETVPIHYSASYDVKSRIEEIDVNCLVDESFYNEVKVGDRIEVVYGIGRLINTQ